MQLALASAKQAVSVGEVPIAAVLMDATGQILATAHNHVETTQNPLAHAEILALTEGLKSRRYFEDCTLAVTLEPCAMCMAALCHARVGTVIFGAYDPKSGGTTNGARVPQHMHFKPEILGGIEEESCRTLLQDFFKTLR
ncbi:MAG: tRNA-specific adenosine deaminase [Pseudomonas fluorescens]|nr:MAG: tRNA-specific adenosine deaminase [Pseudomonas fluorescens]